MQIVIEIPESTYKEIMYDSQFTDWNLNCYERAIKNGTPLPEHHSDLIERDALLDNVKDYGEGQSKLMLIDPYYVRRADTIIPATKEENLEKSCKNCRYHDKGMLDAESKRCEACHYDGRLGGNSLFEPATKEGDGK